MTTAAPGLRSPMLPRAGRAHAARGGHAMAAPAMTPPPRRRLVAMLAAAALLLASCGGEKKPASDLTFESLPDTTGLANGAPVLEEFEPYRMENGAVRVKGHARLPDGTKLQIAIKEPHGEVSVAMAHVYVQGGQFDSPPLIGATGPLPKGAYRFEVLAHFRPDQQAPEVLRALENGAALRGPGVTRAADGGIALYLVQETRL